MSIFKFDNYEISLSDFFKFTNDEQKFEFLRTDNYISITKVTIDKNSKICEIYVDLIRTFPIFYYWKDNKWYIKDRLSVNDFKNWEIDKFLKEEFLLTGYVTGENTLLKGIVQVESGTKVFLHPDGNKKIERYFTYSTYKEELLTEPLDHLKIKFKDILYDVFNDLIQSLKNKTVVIPLSGGYDSRLIACMMKEMGYEDVICFTYGKKDSFEVFTSKEVASKLGYKWYFVEYKKNLYLEIVKKDIFYEYLDFDFNFVSLPHTQDFFAVYYLKKNYLIPENSVFIPGHSGDFFAGTHIYNVNYNSNKMHIANEIFNHHYILSDYCSYKHELINRIFFQLKDGLPWTVMENWDLENRQAKFIVNSLRVYEFFGYENRIPLWNPKLANYFKKIDIKYKNRNNSYKLKNNLYDSIAMKIFNKYNVDIKKKVSNNNILLKIIKKTLKYIILKTRILKLLYYKYINRAKIDVNNYKDLCDVLEIDYNININKSLIKFIKRKLLSST